MTALDFWVFGSGPDGAGLQIDRLRCAEYLCRYVYDTHETLQRSWTDGYVQIARQAGEQVNNRY